MRIAHTGVATKVGDLCKWYLHTKVVQFTSRGRRGGGGALPEFKTIALLSCTVYLAVLIGMKSNEVYTKQLALIFFVYTYSTFLYLKFVHLLHETF